MEFSNRRVSGDGGVWAAIALRLGGMAAAPLNKPRCFRSRRREERLEDSDDMADGEVTTNELTVFSGALFGAQKNCLKRGRGRQKR